MTWIEGGKLYKIRKVDHKRSHGLHLISGRTSMGCKGSRVQISALRPLKTIAGQLTVSASVPTFDSEPSF